jgi:O-antigen biosynthesis protein
MQEMLDYASKVEVDNHNKIQEFPRLAFFCTLIKKEVFDKIGGLDERFSPGNYEDDDFCMRAQVAGFKAHILRYVFIHHYRSRSFAGDGNDAYRERLAKNRNVFAQKWGGTPDEIWLEGKLINPPDLYVAY